MTLRELIDMYGGVMIGDVMAPFEDGPWWMFTQLSQNKVGLVSLDSGKLKRDGFDVPNIYTFPSKINPDAFTIDSTTIRYLINDWDIDGGCIVIRSKRAGTQL